MREPFTIPLAQAGRDLDRVARQRYDVLIVGGGINGAGLARDLALRGLKVLLAEKGDFACGTSSASTKLVHGGLRYLENLDFGLVFEACRERRTLQTIAPHLVRPLPFFIPVYREDPRSLLTIRLGMILYDLLALFRNTHQHSILSKTEALAREAALRSEGLTGVAVYWDCRMDDARLCLENILAAREAGAEAHNYLEATGFLKEQGRLCGARLVDGESGRELAVEAAVVVNAAGPWLDRVCSLDESAPPKLRPTRGTHILVPRVNQGEEALYMTAGRDDRLFFVIPWGGLSLIGTTDVDYQGDPDAVHATTADIDYLLQEAGRHLDNFSCSRHEVVASFAGLRPLIAEAGIAAGRVSREHRVFESPSGLISVGGGKYTTYRAVAAEIAELIVGRLGRGGGTSLTDRLPLPGGATGEMTDFAARIHSRWRGRVDLPADVLERYVNRYGSRVELVLSLLAQDPGLGAPVSDGSSLREVEVAFAVGWEMARTPEDVLRRRTSISLEPGRGLGEVEGVARIVARLLDAEARREDWVKCYRKNFSS